MYFSQNGDLDCWKVEQFMGSHWELNQSEIANFPDNNSHVCLEFEAAFPLSLLLIALLYKRK